MVPHNSGRRFTHSRTWAITAPRFAQRPALQTMPRASTDELALLKAGRLLIQPKWYLLSDTFQIPPKPGTITSSTLPWALCFCDSSTRHQVPDCVLSSDSSTAVSSETVSMLSVKQGAYKRGRESVCVCRRWDGRERKTMVSDSCNSRSPVRTHSVSCLIQCRCSVFAGEINKRGPFLCLSLAHATSYLIEIRTKS